MKAYNDAGRTWELSPELLDTPNGKIVRFYGPASYYLEQMLKWPLDSRTTLTVDIGGRNFGSSSSVYVDMGEIKEFLVQKGILEDE